MGFRFMFQCQSAKMYLDFLSGSSMEDSSIILFTEDSRTHSSEYYEFLEPNANRATLLEEIISIFNDLCILNT